MTKPKRLKRRKKRALEQGPLFQVIAVEIDSRKEILECNHINPPGPPAHSMVTGRFYRHCIQCKENQNGT